MLFDPNGARPVRPRVTASLWLALIVLAAVLAACPAGARAFNATVRKMTQLVPTQPDQTMAEVAAALRAAAQTQ